MSARNSKETLILGVVCGVVDDDDDDDVLLMLVGARSGVPFLRRGTDGDEEGEPCVLVGGTATHERRSASSSHFSKGPPLNVKQHSLAVTWADVGGMERNARLQASWWAALQKNVG